MFERLIQLRERRANGERGFTLIELLVVVVIIGILIAIAIPLYLNYRKGANDKSAQSDLRGAIAALERCSGDNPGAYPASLTAVGTPPTSYTACTNQAINVSSGTTLAYFASTITPNTDYVLESKNSNGTNKIYCYTSAAAGSVRATAASSFIAAYGACPA